MTIKTGNIVSHAGALEWGAGKVLEVTASMATIQFSDGKSRKIAASHFTTLQPTATASYIPPPRTRTGGEIHPHQDNQKKDSTSCQRRLTRNLVGICKIQIRPSQ